jgi:hypothetical protein
VAGTWRVGFIDTEGLKSKLKNIFFRFVGKKMK